MSVSPFRLMLSVAACSKTSAVASADDRLLPRDAAGKTVPSCERSLLPFFRARDIPIKNTTYYRFMSQHAATRPARPIPPVQCATTFSLLSSACCTKSIMFWHAFGRTLSATPVATTRAMSRRLCWWVLLLLLRSAGHHSGGTCSTQMGRPRGKLPRGRPGGGESGCGSVGQGRVDGLD